MDVFIFVFLQSDGWKAFWSELCDPADRHQLHWPGGLSVLGDHGLQVHLDWQQGGAAPRPRHRRDDQPRPRLWEETLDTGFLCILFFCLSVYVIVIIQVYDLSEFRHLELFGKEQAGIRIKKTENNDTGKMLRIESTLIYQFILPIHQHY